jgi:hypothetical protein
VQLGTSGVGPALSQAGWVNVKHDAVYSRNQIIAWRERFKRGRTAPYCNSRAAIDLAHVLCHPGVGFFPVLHMPRAQMRTVIARRLQRVRLHLGQEGGGPETLCRTRSPLRSCRRRSVGGV